MSSVSPRKDKDSSSMAMADNRRVAAGPESRYTEPTRTSSSSFKPPMSKEAALKKEMPKPIPESSIYSAFSYVKSMFSGKSVSETSTKKDLNNRGRQNVKTTQAVTKNAKDSNVKKSGSIVNMRENVEKTKPVLEANYQGQPQSNDLRVATAEKPERPALSSFSPKLDSSGKPEFQQARKREPVTPVPNEQEPQLKYNHIRFVENKSTYLHTPDKKGTTSFRITTGPNVNVKPTSHQSPVIQQKKGGKSDSKSKKNIASPRRSRKSGSTPGSPSRVRRKPSPDRNMVKPRPVSLSTTQKSLKYSSQTNAHQSKSSFSEYELPVSNVKTSPKASNVKNSGNHHLLNFTSETMSRSDTKVKSSPKVSRPKKTAPESLNISKVSDFGHRQPVEICESSTASFRIKTLDKKPATNPLDHDLHHKPVESTRNEAVYIPPTVLRSSGPTSFAPPPSTKSQHLKTKDPLKLSSSSANILLKAKRKTKSHTNLSPSKKNNRSSSPKVEAPKCVKKRNISPSPVRNLDTSNTHKTKTTNISEKRIARSASQQPITDSPKKYPSRIVVRRSPNSSPKHEIVTTISSTVPVVSVNLGDSTNVLSEGIVDRGFPAPDGSMNFINGHTTGNIGTQEECERMITPKMDLVSRCVGDRDEHITRECSGMDIKSKVKIMKGINGARDLLSKRSERGVNVCGNKDRMVTESPVRQERGSQRASSIIRTPSYVADVPTFSQLREPTVLTPTMMDESFPLGPEIYNRSNSSFCCNTLATKRHAKCFQYDNVDFEIDFFSEDIFYERNTCNSALSRKAIGYNSIPPTCLKSETDYDEIYEIPFGPSVIVEKTNVVAKTTHKFRVHSLANDETKQVEKDGEGIAINFFTDETVPKKCDLPKKLIVSKDDDDDDLKTAVSNKQNDKVKVPDRDFPRFTSRSRVIKSEQAMHKSTIPYNTKGLNNVSPKPHQKVKEIEQTLSHKSTIPYHGKRRANSSPRLNIEKTGIFIPHTAPRNDILPEPVEPLSSTIPYNKKRNGSSTETGSSSTTKKMVRVSPFTNSADNVKPQRNRTTRFLEARGIVESSPSFDKPTSLGRKTQASPTPEIPTVRRSLSTAIGDAFDAIAEVFKPSKPREAIPPVPTAQNSPEKTKPDEKTTNVVDKPLSATLSYLSSILVNSISPSRNQAAGTLEQTKPSPKLEKKPRMKSPTSPTSPTSVRSPRKVSPLVSKRGKNPIPPTVLDKDSISPPRSNPVKGAISPKKSNPVKEHNFATPVMVSPPSGAVGSQPKQKSTVKQKKQQSPDISDSKRSKIDPMDLLRETIKVTLQPKPKREVSKSTDSTDKIDFNKLIKPKTSNIVTNESNIQTSPPKFQKSPTTQVDAPKEIMSPPKQIISPTSQPKNLQSPLKKTKSPSKSTQSILESLERPGNSSYTQRLSPPKIVSDATLNGEMP